METPSQPVDLREPDRARLVDLDRTTLRLWEWGDPTDPTIVCVHGAHDHGRMFDGLAPALAAIGHHVVCPDLRGHGDSGRVGSGHVWAAAALDLAEVIGAVGAPAGLVGHSFGGGLSLHVAAVWPERVRWVVNIDGLGAPAAAFEEERADLASTAARSLDAVARTLARPPRAYATREEMAQRRGQINVRLPEPWLQHLIRHGTRATDAGWIWKTDPRFNTGFPGDFGGEAILAQYRLVRCPVLALTATEHDAWTDLGSDDTAERVAALGARHVPVADAGHYLHLEQPTATLASIRRFLADLEPDDHTDRGRGDGGSDDAEPVR